MILPAHLARAVARDELTYAIIPRRDHAPYYRQPKTRTGQPKTRSGSSRQLVRPFAPSPGDRVQVRSDQGGDRSHVIITTATPALLGEVGYEQARRAGHPTLGRFMAAWVRQHDFAWVHEHANEPLTGWVPSHMEALHPDVDPRLVTRFLKRWERVPVWLLEFRRDATEEPRLLAARPGAMMESDLTADGVPDYVTSGGMALRGELPAVSETEQRAITDRAGMTTQQWQALEKGHRERDLALLSVEERIMAARRLAKQRNVNIERELWLVEKLRQQGRSDEAVVHKLRGAEDKIARMEKAA